MRLKDSSVKLKDIQPQLVLAMILSEGAFTFRNLPFVITSINDGKHKDGSLHYKGRAFDVRTHDAWKIPLPGLDRNFELSSLKQDVKNELGPDFDVIIEDPGGPNEHMHIEYDPKPKGLVS